MSKRQNSEIDGDLEAIDEEPVETKKPRISRNTPGMIKKLNPKRISNISKSSSARQSNLSTKVEQNFYNH